MPDAALRTVPNSQPAQAVGGTVVPFRTRDRTIERLNRAANPDPRSVESILTAALQGDLTAQSELFGLMEDTWPRLQKNLNEVRRAVARVPFIVEPASVGKKDPTPRAKEIAEFVEAALWSGWSARPEHNERDFEDTVYDALDAIGKGVSVQEIFWQFMPGVGVVPRCTRWIPARFYRFPMWGDTEDRLMLDPSGGMEGRNALSDFPANKFIIATATARSGHIANTAMLRSLAKYWIAATFGFTWLCTYAQLFGAPIRWATYDPANKALLGDIEAMLENLGNAGWGAFPTGTTLQLHETSRGAADNPQVWLQETADKACDILILGQTLTTDVADSGSRALGDTHASIRADVLRNAADWASKTLTRHLIAPMVRMNFGSDADCPRLVPDIEVAQDAVALAERDKILFGELGLPVEKAFLYERHKVPEPQGKDQAQLFAPSNALAPAAPAGQPQKSGEGKDTDQDDDPAKRPESRVAAIEIPETCGVLVEARRAVEANRLADNVAESLTGVAASWLAPVRPTFAELIRKAQDKTVTDADFAAAVEAARSSIPELFGALNTGVLAESLYEAMSAAAVNGAVDTYDRADKHARAKRGAS